MKPKAVFIINPVAGRKKPRLIERIIRYLEEDFELISVHTLNESAASVMAEDFLKETVDLLIIGGGDGTINEVINVLVETTVPLGIIPLGTMNVLARELGIPLDPWLAAKVLQSGRTEKITLGNLNGHYFALMAGVGLDAEIVLAVDKAPSLKRRWGSLSYFLLGFKTLFNYSYPLISVTIDGCDYLVYSVVVSNIKRFGGAFILAPMADVMGATLVVIVSKKRGSGGLLLDLLKLLFLGRVPKDTETLEFIPAKNISIESELPQHIQIDGDFWGYTPAKIKAVPEALAVIVPDESKH